MALSLYAQKRLDAILLDSLGNGKNTNIADRSNEEQPGIQVVIVGSSGSGGNSNSNNNNVLYERAVGFANVVPSDESSLPPTENEEKQNTQEEDWKQNNRLLTTNHHANLYSLSKLFTAVCILKLIEQGKIRNAGDSVLQYLPAPLADILRAQHWNATIRDVITHESGLSNPLPLAWVHAPGQLVNEVERLHAILKKNLPRHKRNQNSNNNNNNFAYSNPGYWLLGHIVTSVCQNTSFVDCCHDLLGFLATEDDDDATMQITDTIVPDKPYQYGHVRQWSLLGLVAQYLCPPFLIGPSRGGWIRMEPHLLDGVAFGGLLSSSRTVATWLGKALLVTEATQSSSSSASTTALLSETSLKVLYTPSSGGAANDIRMENAKMTLGGLHLHKHRGTIVYHKEGGGAGCHSTARLRPQAMLHPLAGCLVAGNAAQDVNTLLDQLMDVVQDDLVAQARRKICTATCMVKSYWDGTQLHTTVHTLSGEQPPQASEERTLLLLHGGPGIAGEYMNDLILLLLHLKIASRVILFDQRDVGGSRKAPPKKSAQDKQDDSFFSIDAYVKDVESVRQHFGCPRLHLMAHSWGGVIAMRYAQKYPHHVQSMVLLSPMTAFDASSWNATEMAVMKYNLRHGGWWHFGKLGIYSLLQQLPLVANWACRRLFEIVIRNYYLDPVSAPTVPSHLLQGASARAMVQTKQAFLARGDEAPIVLPPLLSSPSIALCMYGNHDIYGQECVDRFCKKFGGDSTVLTNCGHLLWYDAPLELARRLRVFYGQGRALPEE